MRADEMMRVLTIASRYDRRVLVGNDTERQAEATEWVTTIPTSMTQAQGVAAVRAHAKGASHSQRIAPFHLIEWMNTNATNQVQAHNPMVIAETNGYRACCPCRDLDQVTGSFRTAVALADDHRKAIS